MQKNTFSITGMTCSACSSRVEKTVAALQGVTTVSVNLLKNSMNVSYDENLLSSHDITLAVEKIGYGAILAQDKKQKNASASRDETGMHNEFQEMNVRLFLSLLFTIPLMYIAMGHMIHLPLPPFLTGSKNALVFAFTQFLLTVPVLFINRKFYRTGFASLFALSPNMDSLIAIGSGAATLFGVYAIYKMMFALGGGDLETVNHFVMNLYFESAAMILTLITLGKYFEAKAKGKTSEALTKLMDLAPKEATVIRHGVASSIPLEDVVVDDILVVKTGERIPTDGIITEGFGYIDESAISGESLPLEKGKGATVTGATINTSGNFQMRATRVGDDTTLAQIIALVDEATSSKAPIAQLADKVSGIFVPVVILIACIATAYWIIAGYSLEFSLSIGIAVLVISCPCALGLATPTAIMVGTGRGAANGILLKSAEAIETAQAISAVVLDKTGTITEGKPVVTDIIPQEGITKEELLCLAGSLEALSEHPLATAIVEEAKQQGLVLRKVTKFTQTAGQGIAGEIEHTCYMAGNAVMLQTNTIQADQLVAQGNALAEQGKTALYFVKEKTPIGLIAVADTIKPTSKEAVAELIRMGIDVVMLTGDNAKTAETIQKQAGIPKVIAQVLPQDKEQHIRVLQEKGKIVAMIGDGINDAPALARANVGIAIGAGTDIAIESADIVLMRSDLLDAVTAIQLSRAVMKNIKQNLFWAFFYNIVGIPVSAGVFYLAFHWTLSPMLAAGAMSLSSVSVVSNALRLRFFAPQHNNIRGDRNISSSPQPQTEIRRSTMEKVIRIDGMSCGHCSATVEKALSALQGVSSVAVDLGAKTATLQSADVADDLLKKAVTDAGFTVVSIE